MGNWTKVIEWVGFIETKEGSLLHHKWTPREWVRDRWARRLDNITFESSNRPFFEPLHINIFGFEWKFINEIPALFLQHDKNIVCNVVITFCNHWE